MSSAPVPRPDAAPGSAPSRPLQGMNRWVTGPSMFGGLVAGGLAILYGLITLKLPEGSRIGFAVIAATTLATLTAWGDSLEQAGLRTLRALGLGQVPQTEANLAAAAREVNGIANRAFLVNLIAFAGGAGLTGLGYAYYPQVSWGLAGRVAALGGLFGPVAAVLIYLLVVVRARELIRKLAELGLSAEKLMEAIPARTFWLRRRLLIFTAISALAPTLLIADVLISRAEATFAAMVQTGQAGSEVSSFGEVLATILVAGLTTSVVIACAFLMGSSLSAPVKELTVEATRIASGDLQHGKVIPSEDELWAASIAFSSMQANLASMLARMKQAGVRVSASAEQLVSSTALQESGALEQVPALHETSATTEELARSARQIAENAQEVAQLAERTLAAAREGQSSSEAFFAAMSRLRQDSQGVADSVVRLNKRVQQVGKVVQFITDIADKADLLALNAELEGTKAGEVGRGFSLVASEMRRLAEHVIASTGEIQGLIEEIRDGTHTAVMATESGVKATDAGVALATRVSEGLERIHATAAKTSEAVRAISLATQQQQTGTDELALAMTGILDVTQRGAEATHKMAEANFALDNLARELKGVVDRFRV